MGEELSGMEYMGLKSLCLRKCWPYKEKLLTGLSGLRTLGKLWAQSAAKCQNVGTHKIFFKKEAALNFPSTLSFYGSVQMLKLTSDCLTADSSWCVCLLLYSPTRDICHVPGEHCATFLHWEADYRSYWSANWRQKSLLMNNWVGCAPSSCPWLMPQLIIGWYENRTQPITSPSYLCSRTAIPHSQTQTHTYTFILLAAFFFKGKGCGFV